MNPDIIINALGLIVLPVLAYAFNRITKIKEELEAHKLHVAENYLNKGEFNTALQKLELNIQRIFEKLDVLAERRQQPRDGDAK